MWESSPAFCQRGEHRIRTSPRSLNESARGSSEGAHGRPPRSALVVVEIVLALLLLSSAGLLVESFLRLQKVPPALIDQRVYQRALRLPETNYGKPEQVAEFYNKLLSRVANLPASNRLAPRGGFRSAEAKSVSLSHIKSILWRRVSNRRAGECRYP